MKKTIAVFLISIMLVSAPVREVNATPLVAIPLGYKVLAVLAVGSGLIVANDEHLMNATRDIYMKGSSTLKSWVNGMTADSNGYVTVSDEMWEEVQDYIRDFYGVQGSAGTQTYNFFVWNDFIVSTVNDENYASLFPFMAYEGQIASFDSPWGELRCENQWGGYNDHAVMYDGTTVIFDKTLGNDSAPITWQSYLHYAGGNIYLKIACEGSLAYQNNYDYLVDGYVITGVAPTTTTADWLAGQYITDDSWDIVGQDVDYPEQRKVAVPLGLDDLTSKNETDIQEGNYTTDYTLGEDYANANADANAFQQTFSSHFDIAILHDSFMALENMNTAQGDAPVIYINLYKLFRVGRHINSDIDSLSPFSDEDSVFIDFSFMEDYSFAGMTLIAYMRMLITCGFVLTTMNYVWRKIIPNDAIS